MQTKSIWLDGFEKQTCPSLNKNLEVDVLIIGGGLTGMSCAYHLIDSKLKVALVEKNVVGNGVTSKTTGKLTYLQDHITKIKEKKGLEKTKQYIESQIEAIHLVSEIVSKHQIDCDFKKTPHCLYVHADTKKLNDTFSIYSVLEYPVKQIEKGFYVEESYVFHPLKYVHQLKEICLQHDIEIYENTTVYDIQKIENGYLCDVGEYKIQTKKVVLALHYPYFTIPFFMPLKTHMEKSYLVAYKTEYLPEYSMISLDEPITSTRTHQDYRFHLSGTHSSYLEMNDQLHFNNILENIPNPSYVWSNKDMMTFDGLPFIGSLNHQGDMLLATGYNTWGMTNASLSGKIIADKICNRENPYYHLFDPKRSANLKEAVTSVMGYTKAYIQAPLKRQSHLRYEKRDGRKVAIYTDENKKEHMVRPICPHLKCTLLFNEIEKTWDCPCHGSRFDLDGKVIEGPSQYDISYNEKREA